MTKTSIRLVISLFLANGITALVMSIYISSRTLALIGLGLVFWGAIFLYIEPKKYVQVGLLNSTLSSAIMTVDQLISAMNYCGTAVYLPSKYSTEPRKEKVFINWGKGARIPKPHEVTNNQILVDNPLGLYVTPPGLGLTNLYEDEMGIRFSQIGLDDFTKSLPKVFAEDLEIAESLEIERKGDSVRFLITKHVYADLCQKNTSADCDRSLYCPLCSSIAIALSRVYKKPIVINQLKITPEEAVLEVSYRVYDDEHEFTY
jgi:hypothetical protein